MPARIMKALARLTTFGLPRAKKGAKSLRKRIPAQYDSEKRRAIQKEIHERRLKEEEEYFKRTGKHRSAEFAEIKE